MNPDIEEWDTNLQYPNGYLQQVIYAVDSNNLDMIDKLSLKFNELTQVEWYEILCAVIENGNVKLFNKIIKFANPIQIDTLKLYAGHLNRKEMCDYFKQYRCRKSLPGLFKENE